MIISPYFWLAVLLLALTCFGTGYHNGYKHASDHADALKLQAVAKAREDGIKQAKQDQKTAEKYETARETVRTVYVKIKEKAHENIAKNHDYAECGLDADGLQLYNARPGITQDAPGVPGSAVSGFAAGLGWQTVDHSGEQPGTIADVLRLPVAPQGTGGMGGTGTAGTLIRKETF